jgi:hypothetical protein
MEYINGFIFVMYLKEEPKINLVCSSTLRDLHTKKRTIRKVYRTYLKTNEIPKTEDIYLYKMLDEYGVDAFKFITIKKYEIYDRKQLSQLKLLWQNKSRIEKSNFIKYVISFIRSELFNNTTKNDKDKLEHIKQKQRENYEKNKEKRKQQHSIYYEKNKDRIIQKSNELVNCIFCDRNIKRKCLKNHNSTLKHLRNVKINKG